MPLRLRRRYCQKFHEKNKKSRGNAEIVEKSLTLQQLLGKTYHVFPHYHSFDNY